MKSDIEKRIRRTKPKDIETEKELIKGLIVSDRLCKEIIPIYSSEYLQTKIAKTICTWCVDFFKNYQTAPRVAIQDIFNQKKDYLDPDLSDVVENFLNNLSDEYEQQEVYDHEYWIDKATKYLSIRKYKTFTDELNEAIENEDLEMAEELRTNFYAIKRSADKYEDLFTNENIDRLIDSYGIDEIERRKKIIFTPPGALKALMGDIEKESFIGYMGREKVGKTHFFTELAVQCMKQGKNVAVFEAGDMTMDQFDLRVISHITGKPTRKRHAGKFLVPVLDCYYNQNGECSEGDSDIIRVDDDGNIIGMYTYKDKPDHIPCIECHKDRSLRENFKGSIWWKEVKKDIWTWPEAKRRIAEFTDYYQGTFKRVAWGMGQATVNDIDRKLTEWYEKDNFIAHLVVIDYADILKTNSRYNEKRHQEDEKWQGMRDLSQKWKNCIATGTQSDAKGYKKRNLDMTNFNEDKRKFGHVTHMFSFNKTRTEELYGCMRVGTVLLREDDMTVTNEVTVLQSLRMGKPYLGSFVGSIPGV
jgi:hypothetical protein